MDSVTQAALGAAVGGAVLEKKIGRWALLWGAVLGTLPDLDALVPRADAITSVTTHRGFSHSLLVLGILTPLLAFLGHRLHAVRGASQARWLVMVGLVFLTHILLDALTIYGTQLFWPWSTPPVGRGSIFIIDPAYTLPLLIGIGALWASRCPRPVARRLNNAALLLSTLYLAWGLSAQAYARGVAERAIETQQLEPERVLVQATPFNSLLWRVLLVEEEAYREGYISLLDRHAPLEWTTRARNPELLEGIRDTAAVQRLAWFSKGFYTSSEQDGEVVMTDLRMGGDERYVFSFVVGRLNGGKTDPVPNRYYRGNPPTWDSLLRIWDRLLGRT